MSEVKDVTITTSAIREAWSAMQEGRSVWSDRQHASGTHRHFTAGHYSGSDVSPFVGASGAEIDDRLVNGFDPGELVDATFLASDSEGTTPGIEVFEEDGSFLLSEALAGEDLLYARWTEQPADRGLTIRASFGMHAGTDAKVLGDYCTWLLKVVDAVERQGIAPTVELWIGAKGCFARGDDSMKITIPLVNAGEIIDPIAWRAYLSPGAFRSLGFVALALAADRCKRSLSSGMGRPMGTGWSVSLSDDVLEIDCPPGASSFPAVEMDAQLAALNI